MLLFFINWLCKVVYITICDYYGYMGEVAKMFRIELKKLRESKNISQYKLADELNVSQGAVAMWESGKREPDFKTVQKIASYFNVSVDNLLGNPDIKKEPITSKDDELQELIKDPKLKELYDLLANLPEDQIDDLVKYAEFLTLKQKEDEKKITPTEKR